MNSYIDVRTDLIVKRNALTALIDGLTALIGDEPVSQFCDTPRPGKPGPKPKTAKRAMKRTDGRTDGRSKSRANGAPRSLPDVTEGGQEILDALRVKSPQQPGALAKLLKIARPVLTYRLRPLIKSGAVIATGATLNRQFSLPGQQAKEGH